MPRGLAAGEAVIDELPPAPHLAPEETNRVRLPLTPSRVTYVLLGLIAVMFVAETVLGGSTRTDVLERLGAQVNSLVAAGEYWRLLAAMFLHIGLMHLAFNAWALYSLGRDVEATYGSTRFLAIYLLTGLFGSVAYYLLGGDGLSAGASGAVFGLVGAEIAYFLRNRELFGAFGKQRLGNLAGLVAINLAFGFTMAGINNLAHLGGLLSGMALGWVLSPTYGIQRGLDGRPAVIDRNVAWRRILAVLVAVVLLAGGVALGNHRWVSSADYLRRQAETAIAADDLNSAQALLQQVTQVDPADAQSQYDLGIVYARNGDLVSAASSLEKVLELIPGQPDTQYVLGIVYAELGRTADARTQLNAFLSQESSGDRAIQAQQTLSSLP